MLMASDVGNAVASSTFNITPGPPAKLAFRQQPTSAHGGREYYGAVTVQVQDAYGNGDTANDNSIVTLAITTNPGEGTLRGTSTVAAVNGVATFNKLSINKAGAGYVLTATDGSLTSVASNSFAISGSPVKLAFLQQPGNGTAGVSFAQPVTVVVQDAGGNTVVNNNSSVTLTISANPAGGTLSGSTDRRGGKWRGDVQRLVHKISPAPAIADSSGWLADERGEQQL